MPLPQFLHVPLGLFFVGIIYCLWAGRIDIEFMQFKIIGKGDKQNRIEGD